MVGLFVFVHPDGRRVTQRQAVNSHSRLLIAFRCLERGNFVRKEEKKQESDRKKKTNENVVEIR